MENGFDGKLADKFSGLGIDDPSSNDNLFQVMKAVEAAEATIKQQVDENNRLRNELHEKIKELEQYKAYESAGRTRPVDSWSEDVHGIYETHQLTTSVGNPDIGIKGMAHSTSSDKTGTLVVHNDLKQANEDNARQTSGESPTESSKVNGILKVVPANSFFAQLSSPSTSSISLGRHQTEGEFGRVHSSGEGLMPMTEVNNTSNFQKQDHEQEIAQLRRHLSDYSVKEAHIRNEKYLLEKQIAFMRLAFDQQQQDLVDAASKALSYRQDIMEENIRLSYQLQAVQQERLTFVSSLLPLLAEYSLQPPVPDAQSIVSNIKVLFKHLQEQFNITESKFKESQFQLPPWHLENRRNGLQLVPQPLFTPGKIPISSSEALVARMSDQIGLAGLFPKTMEPGELGGYSDFANRNPVHDVTGQYGTAQGSRILANESQETTKQVKFREPVSNTEMDDTDTDALHNEGGSPVDWNSGNSPYSAPHEEPSSSYSPYLPPVHEEHSSSFSEGPDDDPLPGIDSLQISGDAYPGRELRACGNSINGTTSCNFEWVRHMEDGSVNYIEGAKQPNYLVTADDVGTYLAIEVQPLDNRKRKGELVKVFVNEHNKITCDPDMQNCIEKTLYNGHASCKVSSLIGYLDIWEPATLAVKREGYSIKGSGSSGLTVTEKFSQSTTVTIHYGHATLFSILGSNGAEHILRAEGNYEDVSCWRDTIVLTLRLFAIRACQKKGKKRGLFFNK
ncbi:hypothetical protein SAY86_008663 [Trapa natans]|uniref:Uncharacterized protein n=1 Tax=Trapa natans TaxID=22666 RepID=A0AAN7KHJ5_TRANT|nr:hypothetical protein SAY86_008663 [Trapa natans]